MSSVKAILLSEDAQQKRTMAWHEIFLSLLVMYVIITLLNIYFLYKGIFLYFSYVTNYYKDSEVTLPFGAWKVVLALQYPLLRFRFNNSSTPQIIQQLISSSSCLNPCQCQQCMGQTCTASTNPMSTCETGCAQANCIMQPPMFFGNPGGTFSGASLNNQNWASDPNNFFYPLIKPDAPIVPGNVDPQNPLTHSEQVTAITTLFSGGFVQLAEEFHNWTMPDFMNYVFGSTNQPKAPCSNNYGAFISGIGSSMFAGAMAGSPFGPPVGAIIGGVIGAGFGAFGNYKNISC